MTPEEIVKNFKDMGPVRLEWEILRYGDRRAASERERCLSILERECESDCTCRDRVTKQIREGK